VAGRALAQQCLAMPQISVKLKNHR
jgi:hypothetical protein